MFKLVYLPNGKDCLDIDGNVELFDSHEEASKSIAKGLLPSMIENYSVVEIDGVIGVAINSIKPGEYIKRKADSKTIYIKGSYDRATKSYSCIDVEDMNKEIFIKANKLVFIGFTY